MAVGFDAILARIKDVCKRNGLLILSVLSVTIGCLLGFFLRTRRLSQQVCVARPCFTTQKIPYLRNKRHSNLWNFRIGLLKIKRVYVCLLNSFNFICLLIYTVLWVFLHILKRCVCEGCWSLRHLVSLA